MLTRLLGYLFTRPIVAVRTRRARAHCRAGLVHKAAGRYDAARRALEQGLRIDGQLPECWLALGELHQRDGELDRALVCYGNAVSTAPESLEARQQLARALVRSGRTAEALAHLRELYALDPQRDGVLRELVGVLIRLDNCEKARAVAAEAFARNPGSYEALLSLGLAHQKLHEPERALAFYERALRLRDDDAQLYDLRGSTWQELGRLPEAARDYEQALALDPQFVLARFHRALARLLTGDFAGGWEDYELRRLDARRSQASAAPEWDGSSLAGRTLLVRGEQGLGDEIMFASMLPELIASASHCLVECEPRLVTLFRRSFPQATVFGRLPDGSLPHPVARRPVDVQVAAGSTARFLRRKTSDFPRHAGYLKPDERSVAAWRERLAGLGAGLKVGVSWAGGVRETRQALRSVALERWLPILRAPGTRFVSLQYTAGAGEEAAAMALRHGLRIVHWQEAIDDYDQTAALVGALDLVISVCTSVVHLSGALGQAVWVLAPNAPEWRYGASGDGMPWYPSARIFRQSAYGEWAPVLLDAARELGEMAAQRVTRSA